MNEINIKCYCIRLYGRVQKVGFRYFVYQLASELSVKGFVKNLPDGSVYVEAEGDDNTLEVFISHCRLGPSHSVVKEVMVSESACKGFTDFTIK